MTYGPNLGQHLCLWIDFYYTIYFVYHWEFFSWYNINVEYFWERQCGLQSQSYYWTLTEKAYWSLLQYNKKQISKLWNTLPISNSVKKKKQVKILKIRYSKAGSTWMESFKSGFSSNSWIHKIWGYILA